MADGTDWLYRPVVRGLIREESLYDGTVDLGRIARANEALDVDDENARRWHSANLPER